MSEQPSPKHPWESDFSRILRKVALSLLFLIAALNVVAASQSLALFLDGSLYLLDFLGRGHFFFGEPTARTVQLLQQLPLFVASTLGLEDLRGFIFLAGISNLTLPLILTASCYWVLPKQHKAFFVFPLVHYLAGALASWAPTVTDAPPAAAYFWLLFYLIQFGPPNRTTALLLVSLALPAVWLHEAMSFLAPILALAAINRFRNSSGWRHRTLYAGASAWFVVVACLAIAAILDPRSPGNRDSFVFGLIKLLWLDWDGLNMVVVTSAAVALAGAAVIADNLTGKSFRYLGALSKLGAILVGALVLVLVALLLSGRIQYGFFTQFGARAQAVLISFPLALIVLLSVSFEEIRASWQDKRVPALAAWLGVVALSWHAVGIFQWRDYIEDFRSVLAGNVGLVPFEEAKDALPESRQNEFARLSDVWTVPTVSILLAPEGRVAAIVGNRNREPGSYEPFDPCAPEQLPRGPFDYSQYLEALPGSSCIDNEARADTYSEKILGNGGVTMEQGWYAPEVWGAWSKGNVASLSLSVADHDHDLKIELTVGAYVPQEAPELAVDVVLDGVNLETWAFEHGGDTILHRTLTITAERLKGRDKLSLDFLVRNPRSPSLLGLGEDTREIGLRLISARLITVHPTNGAE